MYFQNVQPFYRENYKVIVIYIYICKTCIYIFTSTPVISSLLLGSADKNLRKRYSQVLTVEPSLESNLEMSVKMNQTF